MPGEGGALLGDEGGGRLLVVGGGAERVLQLAFPLQGGGERVGRAEGELLLDRGVRGGRSGRQPRGQLVRGGAHPVVRDDRVDQAHLQGRGGGDGLGEQRHRGGPGVPDQPRQRPGGAA